MQTQTNPRPGSGQMFDRIAGRYDILNRVLSLGLDRRWRRKAASSLGGGNVAQRFLDVACGTGDLSLEILEQYPKSTVLGLDPSAGMLEVMAGKAKAMGGQLEYRLGAAERIDEPDESFDGVTIAFGLRNVADRSASIAEMLRVVRPGRRLVILEFTDPQGAGLAALARFHIHNVVPRIGALLSGESEYRYLEASIKRFPSAPELAAEIRRAGADRVWTESMCMGAVHLFIATRGLLGP